METLESHEDYILRTKVKFGKSQSFETNKADSISYWQTAASARDALPTEKKFTRYIFVNAFGGRLQYQAWNIRLKRYFSRAGIPIDAEKKKDGLSHRLRHGYAMVCIARLKATDDPAYRLKLAHAMRHRSLSSIEPYFTPDQKDLIKTIGLIDRSPDMEAVLSEITSVYNILYDKGDPDEYF